MWFDLILIDKVFSNGAMLSAHIRYEGRDKITVDQLEDINAEFRAVNTKDLGPLRIYEKDKVKTTFLESQLRHFIYEPNQVMFQLDHFGIPVMSGYYAIIFPRGWRVAQLNVYDPYNKEENVAQKRTYRGVDVRWDNSKRTAFAQFNMKSTRRGTFSIGVIASLCPADAEISWQDKPGQLSLEFTNRRHQGHPMEDAYRNSADAVTDLTTSQDQIPGVKVGLSGPSLDIVEWGRYLIGKLRRS